MSSMMHETSVPMFINNLNILSGILLKAEKDAEKRKIDKSIFVMVDAIHFGISLGIGPDMVRLGLGRLADVKAPSFKDNEITFSEESEEN